MANDGLVADQMMQSTLRDQGLADIEPHRSRRLLPHHVNESDLILCMERVHVLQVQRENMTATGKIMLFGRWSNDAEVDDPIGMAQNAYIATINKLDKYSKQWAQKIELMGLSG